MYPIDQSSSVAVERPAERGSGVTAHINPPRLEIAERDWLAENEIRVPRRPNPLRWWPETLGILLVVLGVLAATAFALAAH